MIKCAFDFTGNFETMITPTSIGNCARENIGLCRCCCCSFSAEVVVEKVCFLRALPTRSDGSESDKSARGLDFRGVSGENCEVCASESRIVVRACACRARLRYSRAFIFYYFFSVAHSRCVLSFSFVPLLIWCSKREIFNKNSPFFGNGRRAENECTRRRAKERRVLSCLQYVWARVRDDKFKNNKGEIGLAGKRTNASRSRFSATLPLCVTLFLKFS